MDWLERLKIQANDPNRAVERFSRENIIGRDGVRYQPIANPPATFEEVQEFEQQSGLKLPEVLQRVYLEVGNGGFGPGDGLMRLKSGKNDPIHWEALDAYLCFIDKNLIEGERKWSQYFLPICSGGCDCLGIVDVRDERVGFVQYELLENLELLENIVEWKALSLKNWFEAWMNGEYMMGYGKKFQESIIDVLFNKHYAA
jgi:SMI1 / KNR4 family (SUKH-1)